MAENDFKSFSQKKLPKEWEEEAARAMAAVEGKGEGDVLREIVARAEKAKREGTLSNAEIDAFVLEISPVLDAPKRRAISLRAESSAFASFLPCSGEKEARTSPSGKSPSALWMSGAQCSPPRTQMPYFSESSPAMVSEGSLAWRKEQMPHALGTPYSL